MELQEFAERVLFAKTLEQKLEPPTSITDERPGSAITTPDTPGRPKELRFKSRRTGKSEKPAVRCLESASERGRLLHFFANHELLATELMALVLLRFPEAPAAFRRAVLQTLRDEQEHTHWYLNRMQACGISFGELPVSGYFWHSISKMQSPLDYVAGLSLTFEQANLDFARFFADGFAQAGDMETAQLLDRIYRDEIGHVACGLKWFRKWKNPQQSDWESFRAHLKFPLSAQRAKGPVFNIEGRVAAGLDREFIDELNVFAQSKGRTPGVFVFNPFAEGRIADGEAFTPNKHQQLLQQDLENLPQFLCRQDDLVLVRRRPSVSFQGELQEAGYTVPEFLELNHDKIDPDCNLISRKIGRLRPWAWGPDTLELFGPVFCNVTIGSRDPSDYYNANIAQLYSKEWSAAILRKVLEGGVGEVVTPGLFCPDQQIGVVGSTVPEAIARIEAFRRSGHRNIIVKEALGVAGHNAIRLLEPEILEPQRRWIARALENGRRVVIEPWLERVVDFSIQLELQTADLKLLGYTGLYNDWKGQYRGNWAWPGFNRQMCVHLPRLFPHVPDVTKQVLELYSRIVSLLEQKLRNYDYLGPIGVDAFVYRTSAGEHRIKPIVEVNPRYTMGRLTLELMKNVAPGSSGTLRLITPKMIKEEGFSSFSSWARAARQKWPVIREGEPVGRIREGMICLNDSNDAQVCLAVFHVSRGRSG